MENCIEIKELNKFYGKKKQALSNVNLTIGQGMFGLLGRNGAGKTTLMKTLATLLQKQSGSISVCGIPIENAKAIRKIIGYLPQDFSISASTITWLIHQKFELSIPLYRQEKEWEALGLRLSRATMSNWLLIVYRDWLVHIVHRLKLELLKQRYLHIDETHVQVLKEPGRKNTSDSYMWVYCSIRDAVNPIRYFEYQPGRSGKYPEAFLREYEGYIHTDAYSGYNAVSGVKRCLCYTHLRRAFVDALPKDIHNSEASKPAEAILRLNQLFNLESELEALPPDQKKKERLIREKPLLEAFWSWAEKSAIGELPKSKLSKAFHYALNNREGFWNYLEDGNCSISNSLAENCIRPFVIGRKNWLFSGSPKGAEASAGIYTLVETAKANGLAPMKYIKYILSDMPGSAFLEHPEYLDDYLPWNPLVKEFCR